jgi:predicted dehydrogenase
MYQGPDSDRVSYDVAFVGTGPDPENPVSGESFAQAYSHAPGYLDAGCAIVACADLVRENAEDFAEKFDVPDSGIYEDYEEMLAAEDPDVVSVCTPIPTHDDIVLDVIGSGVVDAVHCEKPMADTWSGARHVAREAWRRDVQLTFNHQRRFGAPWVRAKELLDRGEIGDLERVEMAGDTLLEGGTHYLDLCNFCAGDPSPAWVIGQVDYREENVRYGVHSANQALALWGYENGVHGIASTGDGADAIGCRLRLRGTEGVIEVHPHAETVEAPVRVRRDTGRESNPGWASHDPEGGDAVAAGIEDLLAALDEGREPELSARKALNATELIFGTFESARQRGRVDFPLDIGDNPLAAMVESGALNPQ